MKRRTLLLPLLVTALCLLAGASAARAQDGDHRAGLVIRYPDGGVQTQCVAFSEPSITGEELLQRSGLAVTLDYNAGLGGAVCSINNQGCAFPIKECFCKCTGAQCEYWAYFHRTATGWQYAPTGTSSYQVTDGALEGWSWGAGNFSSGVEPPLLTFADVCSAPATATPTATVTAMPSATPTATSTATTVAGQDAVTPPQVVFQANTTEIVPGECAMLSWNVSDAEFVTLDGTPVVAQDQERICPTTTRSFVLVASNPAGQVVRELIVTVVEGAPVQAPIQPGSTATRTPTAGAAATPSATPVIGPPLTPTVLPTLPLAAVATAPVSGFQPSAAAPEPRAGLGGIAVAHAQELTPAQGIAPATVQNAPAGQAVLSESVALLVAPATSTPRPRRQLGADGRPTPTPILLAYAQPARPAARPDVKTLGLGENAAGDGFTAPSRDFSLSLLPGYAAYLLTLAGLVGAGVWVMRRKANAARKA